MSEHSGDEARCAIERCEAVATFILRLPMDDVKLDQSVAVQHAADLRILATLSRRIITPDDAVVEAVARAITLALGIAPDRPALTVYLAGGKNSRIEYAWQVHESVARAALSALRDAT